MQQAIYNNTTNNTLRINPAGRTPGTVKPSASMVRWITRRWELIGVLTLMGSSAACAAFSLVHLGL